MPTSNEIYILEFYTGSMLGFSLFLKPSPAEDDLKKIVKRIWEYDGMQILIGPTQGTLNFRNNTLSWSCSRVSTMDGPPYLARAYCQHDEVKLDHTPTQFKFNDPPEDSVRPPGDGTWLSVTVDHTVKCKVKVAIPSTINANQFLTILWAESGQQIASSGKKLAGEAQYHDRKLPWKSSIPRTVHRKMTVECEPLD